MEYNLEIRDEKLLTKICKLEPIYAKNLKKLWKLLFRDFIGG